MTGGVVGDDKRHCRDGHTTIVILSEAKDLLFQAFGCRNYEIPRYARNDHIGVVSSFILSTNY